MNLALNDDSVMCVDCWEDLMSITVRIDGPDDAPMGHSDEPCKWCGYAAKTYSTRTSMSETKTSGYTATVNTRECFSVCIVPER